MTLSSYLLWILDLLFSPLLLNFVFNVIVCIALACSPSALLSGFCGSMLYFQIQFLAFILIQKHEQLHCQGLRESPAVSF